MILSPKQLLPSEQENTVVALLNAAIVNAVANREQFDVLDDIDIMEQAETFRVTAQVHPREKRGIERKLKNI